MKNYFPKQFVQWHFEEPTALRRFSLSLWEMALLSGVTIRLYRALVITHGSASWLWTGGTIAFGLLLLCAMTTVHLANFPLKRWLWRAPIFGGIEAVAEALTSLLLIAVGREPIGSARAGFGEWPGMAWDTLWTRELVVCGWALVLAGVVSVVRRTIMRPGEMEEEPEPTEDTAHA